jgi:hypothetical protein
MSDRSDVSAAVAGGGSALKSNRAAVLTLLFLPALLPILALWLYQAFGAFDTDPDYAYLLNALTVSELHPPDFYLHPGTTVEVLGAVIISLVGGARSLIFAVPIRDDVLLHPEVYLLIIDGAFVMLQAVALFYLGRTLRKATGSMTVALVAQGSMFLSVATIESLVKMAPESLLLGATLALAVLCAPLLVDDYAPSKRRFNAIGAVVGFCLATKVNALPLLLVVLYAKGWRARLRMLAACAASFVFFTLPIIKQYFHIIRTYRSFATHTGIYGTGAEGVPSIATLWGNTRFLFAAAPEMFLAVAICLLVWLFVKVRHGPDGRARFVAISGAIVLAQIGLVAKTPFPYYLVPAVATCCLINAAAARELVDVPLSKRSLAWGCAILLLAGWTREGAAALSVAGSRAKARADAQGLLAAAQSDRCRIVYYHDAPIQAYKLEFGDQWVDNRYGAALRALYPDTLFYDFSGRELEAFGRSIGRAEEQRLFANASCVYLAGSVLERFGANNLPYHSLHIVRRTTDGSLGAFSIYRLARAADGSWPSLSSQP